MKTGRIIRNAGWMATAAVAIWLAGFFAFMFFISALAQPEKTIRTEAVIVLTGGPHRINAGLDLLSAGSAGRLFVSGVDERVTPERLLELWNGDGSKDMPCCIVLGHQAQNTRQNAAEARDWAISENVKSIRLVTSEYHMPRAWLEFHHAMPDVKIIVHPVASEMKKQVFWRLAFGEYNKALLTWIYHLLNISG